MVNSIYSSTFARLLLLVRDTLMVLFWLLFCLFVWVACCLLLVVFAWCIYVCGLVFCAERCWLFDSCTGVPFDALWCFWVWRFFRDVYFGLLLTWLWVCGFHWFVAFWLMFLCMVAGLILLSLLLWLIFVWGILIWILGLLCFNVEFVLAFVVLFWVACDLYLIAWF